MIPVSARALLFTEAGHLGVLTDQNGQTMTAQGHRSGKAKEALQNPTTAKRIQAFYQRIGPTILHDAYDWTPTQSSVRRLAIVENEYLRRIPHLLCRRLETIAICIYICIT